MDPTRSSRALQIGAVCLVAVFALLLVRAPWAAAGAEAEGGTVRMQPEAAVCGGGDEVARDAVAGMEIALAEAMEQTRREKERYEEDPSGWVVLNNRGYNYGPPPPVRIDPDLFIADPEAAAH